MDSGVSRTLRAPAEVLATTVAGVRVLTLSNPSMRNAFTAELSADLAAAVESTSSDPGVGAIVIAGASPSFCAGADLAALSEAGEDDARSDLQEMYRGFLAVAACPLPTVAAVNGPAVGAGLNLALACDVRLVGPRARFDARFVRLGLHPGGGMTWMLQRAVGAQVARAMTLFSHALDAEEAVRTGLAWRGIGLDDPDTDTDTRVVDAAIELAARAAAVPTGLVTSVKATMQATSTMTEHLAAVDHELGPQSRSIASEHFVASVRAARER
jgi:enoyl-CoA hydratase